MTMGGHDGSPSVAHPPARVMKCAPKDESSKAITYEVVHWISGRIRLRIPRLAHDARFAQRLGEEVMLLPGLKEARVNAISASLVVMYRVERAGAGRPGSRHAADRAILPHLLDCIRTAGNAEVAQVAAQDVSPALRHSAPALPGDVPINYVDRLGLPGLAIALSAGAFVGLAIPGLVIGGVILAAAIPIFKRTVQGLRDEKRLTVDFLDATALVLLTAQASFLAPAIVIGIIEGSEILRDWTARPSRQAALDLALTREGHTGHEPEVAEIIALLDAAPHTDTRVSNYARKVGNGAVVPTAAIAAAVWGTTGSVARATGIVSLDLGTGMRVSAPIAILSAQARAAREGILLRSGRALEMLVQVDILLCCNTLHPDSADVVVGLSMALHNAYTGLLPQQKVELVQALRANGHTVAVVGDGINDAAAMAHADVAIALGSATDVARASADIVLLSNDLRDLILAAEIAGHAMALIEQNKWIVVAPNVAAIAYGVLTVLNPIAGVVINNGTAMVAALNSFRPLHRSRSRGHAACVPEEVNC